MRLNEKTKWFMAEDDGSQSAGMTAVNDPPAHEAGTAQGVEEHETAPTLAPVVDAAELAKQFGAVITETLGRQEPPATKKIEDLTSEEADKILNVWKPTPEWVKKFDNLDTRESALSELRDGLVKHTDTVSQYRLKELQTAIDSKYAPVLSYMEEQRERQLNERFAKVYPQLSDDAMTPLLKAVGDQLEKAGKKFKNERELFDELAKGAEAVIKVTNPTFKLTAGSTPAATTKTKGQPRHGIPVTTPGAGGGVATDGPPATKPRGLAIFD